MPHAQPRHGSPGSPEEQWSVAEVAAYLDVRPHTVTAYLARGQMPQPDGRLGRTPWWWAETIHGWRTRQ